MFYRDKLSRSEISRRTGLSRNTIKKWLDAAEGAAPKYRRESTPGKLTPFHAFLLQALEASLSEILCVRHNMSAIRSMYAKQDDQEARGSDAAQHSQRTH
jgi:transposase